MVHGNRLISSYLIKTDIWLLLSAVKKIKVKKALVFELRLILEILNVHSRTFSQQQDRSQNKLK